MRTSNTSIDFNKHQTGGGTMPLTLEEMRNIDIKDVNSHDIVDIKEIKIDANLPKEERMLSTIEQMNGNPYIFKSGNIIVKISHMETPVTMDERMEGYLRTI
jgi:hypothetical protein